MSTAFSPSAIVQQRTHKPAEHQNVVQISPVFDRTFPQPMAR
ncbi:MAG: hypothetical protein Q4B95_10185 [Lonepinella koalarum]|nr:hypothetical protein [Lonepinella koalarum]MDO4431632.1 hypothetical protein [Lonepinella koalarum]